MDQSLDFNVSLYDNYPSGESSLHKLMDMAEYRLHLYKILKQHEVVTLQTLKTNLEGNPLAHLLDVEETPEVLEARKVDYISHWVFKVLYCDTHPDFFVKCETRWAKLRYDNMPHDRRMDFLKTCKFDAPLASEEERQKLQIHGPKWYKINFVEVCVLVRQRLCPLSLGFAYIPEHKLGFWFTEKLKKQLQEDLTYCREKLPLAEPQLKCLAKVLVLVTPYESRTCSDLTFETLEANAVHFPLCMKVQHEALRQNHHLKYPSRRQYGLFLKGLGLSLDDALKMWKEEFLKVITEKAFDKEFPYYFSHQYGLKGSKIDYPPDSCDRILEDTPSFNQINGCPFKIWDAEDLRRRLIEDKVAKDSVNKILLCQKEEKYKKACTLYLEDMTGSKFNDIVNHPVSYYEKSCASCRRDRLPDIEDLFHSDSSED